MEILNLADVPHCLELISGWHHNEWSYLNPGRTFEKRLADMQKHLLGNDIPTTFVAISDQVLGSAALIESDMPERSELTPWLASVFVAPEARKNGVGRALVQRVMQHAKASGVKTMYLYTPDRAHFYKHMGWQTIEEMVYHGANVTLMKIDL